MRPICCCKTLASAAACPPSSVDFSSSCWGSNASDVFSSNVERLAVKQVRSKLKPGFMAYDGGGRLTWPERLDGARKSANGKNPSFLILWRTRTVGSKEGRRMPG